MDILEVELDALLASFGSKVLVPSFVHFKRSDFCARLFVEISCFLITCRHSWIHIHYPQLRLRVLLPSPRGLLFDMLPVRATRKLWALEMAAIGGADVPSKLLGGLTNIIISVASPRRKLDNESSLVARREVKCQNKYVCRLRLPFAVLNTCPAASCMIVHLVDTTSTSPYSSTSTREHIHGWQ